MRKLLAASFAATTLTCALSFSGPAMAEGSADPTVDQIYQATRSGHFDQAQQMMDQVLRDHPKSAKAHYVQAELYSKEGKTALARSELGQAEQLDPGLPHESGRSVEELKAQLGLGTPNTESPRVAAMTSAPAAPHFPWGTAVVLVLVVGFLWMLFRRRSAPQYPAGSGPMMGGGPGTYGGPGGYGGAPMGGGGMGSGIVGGLASGLAVGAGVVAGEEIAHHFMDGGSREGGVVPAAGASERNDWQDSSNSDMGGSDFGVNDSGSWDDSGSSGGDGGGGGDW